MGNSLKKWAEEQKRLFFIFLSASLNNDNYDKNITNYYDYLINESGNSLENKDKLNKNEMYVIQVNPSNILQIAHADKVETIENHESKTKFSNYLNLIKEEQEGNYQKISDKLNIMILNFDHKANKKDLQKKSEEITSLIKTKIQFFKTKFKDRLYTILSNILMSEMVNLGIKSLLIFDNNSNFDLPSNSFSSNFRDSKRTLLNLFNLEYIPNSFCVRVLETLSLSTFGFEKVILQKLYQPKSEIYLDETLIVESFKIKFGQNEKNLLKKIEKHIFIWFIKLADKIRFSYESLEIQIKNNADLSDFLSKIEESRKTLDDLMEGITLSIFENADLAFLIENIDLLIPIVIYFKTIYNQEKNRFFTCLFKSLLTLIDLCLSSPSHLQAEAFIDKVFLKYNEIEECILQLLQLFFVFETRTIFTENLNKEIISIHFFRRIMEIRMVLSELEKNKAYFLIDFFSHFAFNQILFHSLTNDNNLMRDYVIELLEGEDNLKNFLIIFDSFYNSNKVIFLCNFNLLRKRVLRILDDHMHNLNQLLEKDKETEIVKVYAKTYAYCFLLWADTSSLENDFTELKVLKPFYELAFETLFEKLSFSMVFDAEQLKILEQEEVIIAKRDISNKLDQAHLNKYAINGTIRKNKLCLNLLKQALSTKYRLVFENSIFFLKSIMFKLYEENIPIEKFRYYLEKILILNSPLIESFGKIRELREIRINGFYDLSFETSQKNEGIQILYLLFEMMRERYIWRRNKMEEYWIKLNFSEESQSFHIVHSQEEKECELLVMIISEFISKMKFSHLNDKNIVDYLSDIFKCFMDDLMLYLPFLIQIHTQTLNKISNPFNNKNNEEDQELMRRIDKIKYNQNFILRILKQIPLFLNLYKMFFSFIEKTSPKTPNISIEFRKLNHLLLKNMTSVSMSLFEIPQFTNKQNHIQQKYVNPSKEKCKEMNVYRNPYKQCCNDVAHIHSICECSICKNDSHVHNKYEGCICDLQSLLRVITCFEILKKTCEFLHESKLPILFLNDTFFNKLHSVLTYIHSLLKSNQIDYLLIQSTETEQGYFFPKGKTFILMKLVQVIFNKIIINILPDFLLSDLLFSEFTIINDSLFTQILEKTISIFEKSILIWALVARNNEEIPIKIICIFEEFVLHPRTPRKNNRLETLAGSLISLFLKSTYVFRMRIRSIYLYKLVHKLVMLRSAQDNSLFLPLKNQYLLYFIQLLTYHFQELYPLWDPFQHFPLLSTLLLSSSPRVPPPPTPSSYLLLPSNPGLLLPPLSLLLPSSPSFCLLPSLPSVPSTSSSPIPSSIPLFPSSSLPSLPSSSLHPIPSSSLPPSPSSSLPPNFSSFPFVPTSSLFFAPSSSFPFIPSSLPPIESSCIHAMLSNLISRLLTCENSLQSEPVLDQGIRMMFWHWPASKGFCRYVIGLLRKVREKKERMSQEDLDTLHNDTIANFVEMMREEGEERRRREEKGRSMMEEGVNEVKGEKKEEEGEEEVEGKEEEEEEGEEEDEGNDDRDEKDPMKRSRMKCVKTSWEGKIDEVEFSWSDYYDLLRDFLKEYVCLREKGGGCAARAEILKEIISLLTFENNPKDDQKKEERKRATKTNEVNQMLEKARGGAKEGEVKEGGGGGQEEGQDGRRTGGDEQREQKRGGGGEEGGQLGGIEEFEFLDRTLDGLKLKREGHCDYIERFSGELLRLVDQSMNLDNEDKEKNIEFLIKAAFFNETLGEFIPYIKLKEKDDFIENAFALDNHLFLKQLKEKCRFFRLNDDTLAISLKEITFDRIDPIETILFGQMTNPNLLSKNTLFNILLKKLCELVEESLANQVTTEMPYFFTIDLIIKYLSIIFSKFPLLLPHLLNYPMPIIKHPNGKISNFFIEKQARYQKQHAFTLFEFVLIYYDISPNAFRQLFLMITTIPFHFYRHPNTPDQLINSSSKIRLILLKHFSFEFSNGNKHFSFELSNVKPKSDLHILSLRNNMQITLLLFKNEKNPKIIKNLFSEVKLAWLRLMEAAHGFQPVFLSVLKCINFFGLLAILNKLQIEMLFEEEFQMKWQKNGAFLKYALNSFFSGKENDFMKFLDIDRERKRFEEFNNPNKNISEEMVEEIVVGKEGEGIDFKVDQNLFYPESKESMRVYGDFGFESLIHVLGELPNVEKFIEKESVLYFSYDFYVPSNYIFIPNLKLYKSSSVFFNLLSSYIDPSKPRQITYTELNSGENEENSESQENEESQEILASSQSLIGGPMERSNERSVEQSMERSIERSLERSVERSMGCSMDLELFREKRKFMFFQENFQLKKLMNERVNIDLLSKEIQKLNKDNKKKIASLLDDDLINDLNPNLKSEIKEYRKEKLIKDSLNISINSFSTEKSDNFPNECQSREEIPSTSTPHSKIKESKPFFDFTCKFLFEVNQLEKSSLERIFLCLYLYSEKATENETNCSSIFKLLKTYLFNPNSAVLIVNSLRILLVHHLEHMDPFVKIAQKSQMDLSLEMINAILGFLIKLMEKNYVLPLIFEREVGVKNFELSFEFLKRKVDKMEECNFFFLILKQLKKFEYLANMELSVSFKPVILNLTQFIKTYMVKNGDYLASEEELDLLVSIFYERKLRLKYFELSLYQFFLEYSKNHTNYISFFVRIVKFYCQKLTEHLNKNEFDENFNNDFHLFRHLIKDLISLTSKLDNKFFIDLFEADFQAKFGLKPSIYEGNKDTLSIQLKNRITKWVEKRKRIYISNQIKEKVIANQVIVDFFSALIQKISTSLNASSVPTDLYPFFVYPIKSFLIFYQFISSPIPQLRKSNELPSFCPIKTCTTIDKLSSTQTIEEKEVNTSKSNEIINSNPSLLSPPPQFNSTLPEKPYFIPSFPLLPPEASTLPPDLSQNASNNPFEPLFEALNREELEKLMYFLIESKENELLGNYMCYLEQADPKKIKLEIKIGYLRWITRKKLGGHRGEGVVDIQIDRKKIWETTLEGLAGIGARDLAGKVVRVGFVGEEGIDYGKLNFKYRKYYFPLASSLLPHPSSLLSPLSSLLPPSFSLL